MNVPLLTELLSWRKPREKFGLPISAGVCYAILLLASVLELSVCPSSNGAEAPSISSERLSRANFMSGDETLRALAPISKYTRDSVVKLDLNGTTVALGAVIDSSGLAITKASEVRQGKLTCWLANGKEVTAELRRVDQENRRAHPRPLVVPADQEGQRPDRLLLRTDGIDHGGGAELRPDDAELVAFRG